MSDIYREIIANNSKLEITPEQLRDEQTLLEDLEYDSVGFVSMVIAIEEAYDFSFDDEYIRYDALKTVKDVAEYIEKKTHGSRQ